MGGRHNNRNVFLSSSGDWKSEIKVSRDLLFSEASLLTGRSRRAVFSVTLAPFLIKTLVLLDLDPLIWLHRALITSLVALPSNRVTVWDNEGLRTSTYKSEEEGNQSASGRQRLGSLLVRCITPWAPLTCHSTVEKNAPQKLDRLSEGSRAVGRTLT